MTCLVYLNHYDIRQCKAQYLSVLYEVLSHNLDSYFLLNKDYLDTYTRENRWEVKWAENHFGAFNVLWNKLKPENYKVMKKPEDWASSIKGRWDSSTPVKPSKLLYDIVYGYHEEEVQAIVDVLKKKKIKAGITWVNNRTLKETLEKFNIPTIHHELGPFRPVTYIPTAYLDFSGVNGSTEFNSRFNEFLKIADQVPILSREELIRVISPNYHTKLTDILHNTNRAYEIGVGLQVEVDTNLLLFNKGCSWVDPLLQAQADCDGAVLVRPHPAAGYLLKPSARLQIDDITKGSAVDFINKCNKVYCLNSSIGFEAILLGREAKIFGDSPFTDVCNMDPNTQLKALNFAIFGYLIHRDLLFNEDYYEFRLKNRGKEKVIYLDNMKRLFSNAKGIKF